MSIKLLAIIVSISALALTIFGAVVMWQSQFATIQGSVEIEPDTLKLKEKGGWVTVYLELPETHDVRDINVSSVLLERVTPAEWYIQDNKLMVKFARSVVIDSIWSRLYHMGIVPPIFLDQDIELKVTGKLIDETPFEGSDTVRIKS